jgi:hypothetical protein
VSIELKIYSLIIALQYRIMLQTRRMFGFIRIALSIAIVFATQLSM